MDLRRLLLLALVGAILFGGFVVARLIQHRPTPSQQMKKVDIDVMAMLTSAKIDQQFHGIRNLDSVKSTDPELAALLNTVAKIALTSENRSTPSYAVLHIANTLGRKELRDTERQLLDSDKLTQLLALLVATDTPADMMQPLSLIGGYTSRWQKEPKDQIARIVELLEAAHQRIHNRVPKDFLVALEGYARHHDLPDNGMNFLVERLHGPYDRNSTINSIHIIKTIAARRALSPTVRQSVLQAITGHKELDVRKESLKVLKAEANRTGKIPEELYTAEQNENDKQVQREAATAILMFRIGNPSAFKNLIAVGNDKNESSRVRLQAISIIINNHRKNPDLSEHLLKWLTDDDALVRAWAMKNLVHIRSNAEFNDHNEKFLPYLNAGIKDLDANVRARSVYTAFNLILSDEQKFRFAELAVRDKEPVVRQTLAGELRNKRLPHKKTIPFFMQLLQDENNRVLSAAAYSVGYAGIDSKDIRMHIERLAASEDKELQKRAAFTLAKMKLEARNPFEMISDVAGAVTDAITDTRRSGILVFWLLVAVGVGIAVVFGIYLFVKIFSYINAGSSRSLAAAFGLVVWAGLTVTTGWIFFLGAFGFGHNSLAPLSEQFKIDAALLFVLGVYASLGWLIQKLMRD